MFIVVVGFVGMAMMMTFIISSMLNAENDADIRALAANILLQHRAAYEWVLRSDSVDGDVPARLGGQVRNLADWRSRVIGIGGGQSVLITWAGSAAPQDGELIKRSIARIEMTDIASLPETGVGVYLDGKVGLFSLTSIPVPVSEGNSVIVTKIEENGAG